MPKYFRVVWHAPATSRSLHDHDASCGLIPDSLISGVSPASFARAIRYRQKLSHDCSGFEIHDG